MLTRPRSKLDLADRLCDAIKHLTAGRASWNYALQWVTLSAVAQHLGISDNEAEQAVVLALERRRIITDGGSPPHSVSLIWGGGDAERQRGVVGTQLGPQIQKRVEKGREGRGSSEREKPVKRDF